jgi:hypothetical protein
MFLNKDRRIRDFLAHAKSAVKATDHASNDALFGDSTRTCKVPAE